MLPAFCNQEITRIRPGTTTARGSVIPNWAAEAVDTLKIGGCSIQPAATALSQDGRVLGISESMTAYLPEGADVRPGDRIMFEGQVFTINGEPKVWAAPFSLSHIQLNLVRWEG